MSYKFNKRRWLSYWLIGIFFTANFLLLHYGPISRLPFAGFIAVISQSSNTYYDNLSLQWVYIPVFVFIEAVLYDDNPQYIVRYRSRIRKVIGDQLLLLLDAGVYAAVYLLPGTLIPLIVYRRQVTATFLLLVVLTAVIYLFVFYFVGSLFLWLNAHFRRPVGCGLAVCLLVYIYARYNHSNLFILEKMNFVANFYFDRQNPPFLFLLTLTVGCGFGLSLLRLLFCGKEEYL
ncbi:MAG: hypothetical protein LKI80_06690 [Sporolactobacillus sp.]|jgi:hypothetical protein|nr:hypothetical protein [Sporolactobacillus sp.]